MSENNLREGILFVVSAPSGAGKTSLCRELIDSVPDLRQSISFTTRDKRNGEQDGVDYFFTNPEAFQGMIEKQLLAEYAEVHGNYYGTSLDTLKTAAEDGIDLLLDIDCQGAAQLKKNDQRGIFIFILPPDFTELKKRLHDRGTDNNAVIQHRLENAEQEIMQAPWYDYLVINDDFNEAKERLKAIVTAERCRMDRTKYLLKNFTVKGDK
ncbi:guanylate kinase [uncultured Desulfuromusa sp.]|uniref:guanylate kinase n=1 Tax=uncultured Desulfuromusa sp. TaxID=219183 RepID=UPI002AA8664E|nr:guanylate kinase [uncultured Desulfuromusa sp.]